MSSTFKISQGAAWMPRSVTFRKVTTAVYEDLRESDGNLAQIFLDASNSTMSFLDISSMSANEFNKVITSLKSIEKRLDGYVVPIINELKAIMFLDERCQLADLYLTQGIIKLAEDLEWKAKGWVFDLALGTVYLEKSAFSEELATARIQGVLDWSNLSDKRLEQAIDYMDKLNIIYGKQIASAVASVHFNDELFPEVKQLCRLFAGLHQEAMDVWEQKLIQKMLAEEANKTKHG